MPKENFPFFHLRKGMNRGSKSGEFALLHYPYVAGIGAGAMGFEVACLRWGTA